MNDLDELAAAARQPLRQPADNAPGYAIAKRMPRMWGIRRAPRLGWIGLAVALVFAVLLFWFDYLSPRLANVEGQQAQQKAVGRKRDAKAAAYLRDAMEDHQKEGGIRYDFEKRVTYITPADWGSWTRQVKEIIALEMHNYLVANGDPDASSRVLDESGRLYATCSDRGDVAILRAR